MTYSIYECPPRDEYGRLPNSYIAAVHLEADKPGVVVECTLNGSNIWQRIEDPWWDWQGFDYRIRRPEAEKKWVDMEEADFPAVCWLKQDDGKYLGLIIGFGNGGVFTTSGFSYMSILLTENWLYSSDRKTWSLCRKEAV